MSKAKASKSKTVSSPPKGQTPPTPACPVRQHYQQALPK